MTSSIFLPRRRLCLGALAGGAAGVLTGLGGCASAPAPLGEQASARWSGAPDGTNAIAPFSAPGGRLGELPAHWQHHSMRRDLPATQYALAQRDGRLAMHAVAERSTSGLRCDVDILPQQTPWLSWEWRVDHFPLQATVADDDLDDAPARIVVAFEGDTSQLSLRDALFYEQVAFFTGHTLPFATLMYVWDGQAAPERVFNYPRTSRIRYLVVESGAGALGSWRGYQRNMVEDYRRVFGGEPGRIRSIGILTDSDDIKNRTEAWFGDVSVSQRVLA